MGRDNLSEHIALQIALETAVLADVSYGLAMLLLDDDQIPVDVRYRKTTKSGKSDYTAATQPRTFADDFWSQSRSASELMFGRWVQSAIAGYYVGGAPSSNIASFVALTGADGFAFAVDGIDGGSGAGVAVDINGFDFSAATDMDDVLAEINTVLQAVNVGAFAAYSFAIDALGRIYVSDATDTGASSAEVTVSSPSAGTDMTSATYLNTTGGTWVDGMAAETPTEALDAIRQENDEFFCVAERGASADEQVEISTYVNALDGKICVLWEDTYTECNDINSTTQAFPRIYALAHKATHLLHDPNPLSVNPDAAMIGAYIPALAGTIDWANWRLSNVTSSHLGTTVKGVLDAMNINYFETQEGITYNPYGLTASGDEMRWIVGKAWLFDAIQRDLFSAKIAATSWGFNIETFGTIEGIIRKRGNEAITRGFCVNTEARPFTVSIPDPDIFDAATRAGHTATFTDAFRIYLDSAIYDMALTGVLAL